MAVEQFVEELLAMFRDSVDLATPGRGEACAAFGDLQHRNGFTGLQAGEGGIEGAEREATDGPQNVPEPAPEFIAVQVLFLEETKDGELEDGGAAGTDLSIYRFD